MLPWSASLRLHLNIFPHVGVLLVLDHIGPLGGYLHPTNIFRISLHDAILGLGT